MIRKVTFTVLILVLPVILIITLSNKKTILFNYPYLKRDMNATDIIRFVYNNIISNDIPSNKMPIIRVKQSNINKESLISKYGLTKTEGLKELNYEKYEDRNKKLALSIDHKSAGINNSYTSEEFASDCNGKVPIILRDLYGNSLSLKLSSKASHADLCFLSFDYSISNNIVLNPDLEYFCKLNVSGTSLSSLTCKNIYYEEINKPYLLETSSLSIALGRVINNQLDYGYKVRLNTTCEGNEGNSCEGYDISSQAYIPRKLTVENTSVAYYPTTKVAKKGHPEEWYLIPVYKIDATGTVATKNIKNESVEVKFEYTFIIPAIDLKYFKW